MAFEANLRVTH